MSGWIQLHRSLIDWEWYDDANTMRLFLHCCLRANFEDAKWRGIDIKRGTFITSIKTLSEELKLSESKIKLSIKKLKTTNEIAIKTTNKNTTVTVFNYDTYNNLKSQNDKPNNNQPDNQTTNEQQTNDKQTATDKKNNNKNNNKTESADSPQPPKKTIKERGDTFVDDCRKIWTDVGGSSYMASSELIGFTEYWTESSANGVKMRFEKEKVFAIRRRFSTWVKNIKERSFGAKPSRPINIIDTEEKDYSEPF